jgi:SAM-dependent methyltransferase
MRVDAVALVRSTRRGLRRILGRETRLDTPDRRVLEDLILPYYAGSPTFERVLFVGCAPFAAHYGAQFSERRYWTIDPVARRRRYGSPNHIVGRLEDLDRLAGAERFDLIVCNGVLGWGLNRPHDAERAFTACFSALSQGGHLVVGWNNVAGRRAVKPESVVALHSFERAVFPPLRTDHFEVPGRNRHTYEFFRRPHDMRPRKDIS